MPQRGKTPSKGTLHHSASAPCEYCEANVRVMRGAIGMSRDNDW